MKELSIEEKAALYDEVIDKIVDAVGAGTIEQGFAEWLFPELAESKDERIRKAIKKALQVWCDGGRIISDEPVTLEEALAWLERQGEYINFRNTAKVGDRITKSEDGVLVNLSLFQRVAKEDEKKELEDNLNKALEKETSESWNKFLDGQGKQKPADKVEPKFHEGEWITIKE